MVSKTFQGPIGRLLDWPLWRSATAISVASIVGSGIVGMGVVALVVGSLEPMAIALSFLIPALVVPPAALIQLWALRRAHQSEREMGRFFATTGALLAIGDWRGHLIRLSPSWERLLGHTPIEMAAVHFSEFIHPDDVEDTMREAVKLRSSPHQTAAFDTRFRHKNGSYLWLQWNASADSRRRLVYATAVDITARVEAESFKDSLIATVSHEIRTPLSSLFAALKIATSMQTAPLPAQTQRMLEIAESNAERLVHVIDDMIDLERIEKGTLEYTLVACDVSMLLTTAVDQVRFLFEDADIALVIHDTTHGQRVLVDEQRMQQVLGNLLSNTVKFAPSGSTVQLSAATAGRTVRITVRDEGPGVATADQERVFERFYQSGNHNKGGSGLGLAISQTLVRGMGGEIGIDPGTSPGAVFFVDFPAHIPEPVAEHVSARLSLVPPA
ncbi:MAG: PAS domain-containing sensor histidine kinase [Alphaproteobacteria bacterium]|nr:PAS domain-containing sensor histidine kinase [Alphaproteobacteria bacterium]